MTNGIIRTKKGNFAVKDFETNHFVFGLGQMNFSSYMDAVEGCRGKFYPESYYPYLTQAFGIEDRPGIATWEVFNNMIYANDPRGVWDGEREEWRDVSTMDRGAGTEEEITYIDALDSTYKSLMAMVEK